MKNILALVRDAHEDLKRLQDEHSAVLKSFEVRLAALQAEADISSQFEGQLVKPKIYERVLLKDGPYTGWGSKTKKDIWDEALIALEIRKVGWVLEDSDRVMFDNLVASMFEGGMGAEQSRSSVLKLGEILRANLEARLSSASLASKSLRLVKLAPGETGRIEVDIKENPSIFSTCDPKTIVSQVRQRFIYPPEFYAITSHTTEDREAYQLAGDLVPDKFEFMLEDLLAAHDPVFMRLLHFATDPSLPSEAQGQNVQHSLRPKPNLTYRSLSDAIDRVNSVKGSVATSVVASSLYLKEAHPAFLKEWQPPDSPSDILDGEFGTICGLPLRAVRDSDHSQEMGAYVLSGPETLGAITERKALNIREVNLYNQGRPEQGFFGERIIGMCIVNPSSVACIE